MLLAFLMVLALVATPVATTISIPSEPDASIVLPGPAAVRPLVVDDIMFVATSTHEVVAIDSVTGDTPWAVALPTPASDELVMLANTVLVPGDDGTLYQLDAANGTILRSVVLENSRLQTPVVMDEVVAVPSEGGVMYFLNPATLEQTTAIVLGAETSGRREQLGSGVVVPVDDNVLVSVDLVTESVQWKHVTSSPVEKLYAASDDQLIVGHSHGQVSMIHADGTVIWDMVTESGSVIDIAMWEGTVLISQSPGIVVALDLENGNVTWKTVLEGDAFFASTVCRRMCIATLTDGSLIVMNPIGGESEMVAVLTTGPAAKPIRQENLLVVPTEGGSLRIWRLNGT